MIKGIEREGRKEGGGWEEREENEKRKEGRGEKRRIKERVR